MNIKLALVGWAGGTTLWSMIPPILDVLLAIAGLDSDSDTAAVVETFAGEGALTSKELGTNAEVDVRELGVLDEACCTEVVTEDLRWRGVTTFVLRGFFGAGGTSFSWLKKNKNIFTGVFIFLKSNRSDNRPFDHIAPLSISSEL